MSVNSSSISGFGTFIQGIVYAVIAVANLGYVLWLLDIHTAAAARYQVLAVLSFVLVFSAYRGLDLTRPWAIGRVGSIGTRALWNWIVISALLIVLAFLTKQGDDYSRLAIVTWLASTPFLFILTHALVRFTVVRFFPKAIKVRSAVIVFVSPSAARLGELLQRLDTPRYDVLGFFEDRGPDRTGVAAEDASVLGGVAELPGYVNKHNVEVVFIVLPAHGSDRAFQVVEQLGDTTASIYYVPDFRMFDLAHMRFSDIAGMPVLTLTETPFFGADGLLKRLIDIGFASLALLALSPIFLIVSLCVLVSMGRPIFFTQSRYGLDGREIRVHKFRSMKVSEDGATVKQAQKSDPRVTRVGRFLRRTSIDELPQFWNVLRGQMSVVGPRPHAVAHNELYRKLISGYMVRHKVRPGITGWAQVNGERGETRDVADMERRVQLDIDYIQRWSPELDVRIILRTIAMVFRDEKAY